MTGAGDDDAAVISHVQELRRGTVVLACLAVLGQPMYGYRLLDVLAAAGLEVEGNTLYPLLRRLEGQGLLSSEWDTAEARPRKFYATTASGAEVLARLRAEWRTLDRALRPLLEDDDDKGGRR